MAQNSLGFSGLGKSRCMTAQMSDQVHHLPRAAVPASLIRARMALGTWGREPRGSLPRGPGGEERDRYPRPRSPSRLRRPGRFPHVALSVPVAGKPGSRQHHPPTYRTQVPSQPPSHSAHRTTTSGILVSHRGDNNNYLLGVCLQAMWHKD